jgi:hypothetical protein
VDLARNRQRRGLFGQLSRDLKGPDLHDPFRLPAASRRTEHYGDEGALIPPGFDWLHERPAPKPSRIVSKLPELAPARLDSVYCGLPALFSRLAAPAVGFTRERCWFNLAVPITKAPAHSPNIRFAKRPGSAMMELMEGSRNESAFYGRIIRRAKAVRERAAESLRLSHVLRKEQRKRSETARTQRRSGHGRRDQ